MSDINLACHTGAWGEDRFVAALAQVEKAGYKGIEADAGLVEKFEDRVHVFKEILQEHGLRLAAITARGGLWPGMNLEEEVERGINTARFLNGCGAELLTLYPPRPSPDEPLEDELDLLPAATAYGEIARRTLELGVQTCLLPAAKTCVSTPDEMNRFIKMADPEAMKICLEPGFLAQARQPFEKFIRANYKRIGLVHLRDWKKPRSRKKGAPWVPAPLGRGEMDLEEFVDSLLGVEFSGWATIVPAGVEPPAEQVHKAFTYARDTLDLVL